MDLENIEYLLKSGLPVDGSDVEELVKQYRASHVANVKLTADNRRYMQRIAALDGELDNLRAAIDEANAQEAICVVAKSDIDVLFKGKGATVYGCAPHMLYSCHHYDKLYARPIPAQQSLDGYMLVRADVIDFLNGSGELVGCGFGEKPYGECGAYWWRRFLPDVSAKSSLMQQPPAVAVQDSDWLSLQLRAACSWGKTYSELRPTDWDECMNKYVSNVIADKPESPRITEQEPVFDLDKNCWDSIKQASKESTWIPKEYFMNDWVSDVCEFLRNGLKREKITEQDALAIAESLGPFFDNITQSFDLPAWHGRVLWALLDKLNGDKS